MYYCSYCWLAKNNTRGESKAAILSLRAILPWKKVNDSIRFASIPLFGE